MQTEISLWNKRTLAAHLGASVKTIDRWVSDREIPFIKVGRLVRFDRAEIERWLDDRRVEVAA